VAVLALKWADEVIWSPDALFYQTRVEQIRGASEQEALDKVWNGPLAAGFRADDSQWARADQALADPRWIRESYDLYARRWTVPALAAAVYPIFGIDSLMAMNIFGTLVFAVALYLLLRLRFDPLASFIGVAAVLAWPDLRWAFLPLSDAWGLAMLTITFLIGVKTLDGRSWSWLAAWVAAILILSVSRELTPIPVLGAAAVAIVYRWRQPAILALTGILATLPAQLLFQGGKSLNWGFAYASAATGSRPTRAGDSCSTITGARSKRGPGRASTTSSPRIPFTWNRRGPSGRSPSRSSSGCSSCSPRAAQPPATRTCHSCAGRSSERSSSC